MLRPFYFPEELYVNVMNHRGESAQFANRQNVYGMVKSKREKKPTRNTVR